MFINHFKINIYKFDFYIEILYKMKFIIYN